MGIDGLLQLLKRITQKEHISSFKGQNIGIDVSPWLYKGCYNQIMQTDQQILEDPLFKTSPSNYILEMANLLLHYNIKPLFVFDGRSLKMKGETIQKRMGLRQNNKQKLNQDAGNQIIDRRKLIARSVTINQQIISETMELFRQKKLNFIVAPYQADSQLAKLKQLHIVDTVITEDSDLLVYGINTIFKLNQDGECDYIDIQLHKNTKIESNFVNSFVNMSWDQRISVCALSGCDYVDSIKGIGIKRSIKLVEQSSSIKEVLNKLSADKKYSIAMPQNYETKLLNSINIFKHALTFNPICIQTQSYTNFQSEQIQSLDEVIGLDYEAYIQLEVYSGKYQAKTLQQRIFPQLQIVFNQQTNILKLSDLQKTCNSRKKTKEELEMQKQQQIEANMLDALYSVQQNQKNSMDEQYQPLKLTQFMSRTLYGILSMNDIVLSY